MKKQLFEFRLNFLLGPIAVLSLIFGTPTLRAEKRPGDAAGRLGSIQSMDKSDDAGQAWASIQQLVKDMETAVQSKNLHGIHEPSMKIRAPIRTLKKRAAMLSGEQGQKINVTLKQLDSSVTDLHSASDEGNQAAAEEALKSVQGALEQLKVEDPEAAFKQRNWSRRPSMGAHVGWFCVLDRVRICGCLHMMGKLGSQKIMKRLAKARFSKAAVVILAVLTWLTASNHCLLGSIAQPREAAAPSFHCPAHCSKADGKPSRESGMLACCQGLLSSNVDTGNAKVSIDSLLVGIQLLTIIGWLNLPKTPKRILPSVEYDTGPPWSNSFVETVLQRSLRENAPPGLS
jgi:hypothetical protein